MKKFMLLVALAVLASNVSMAQGVSIHRFNFSDTLETQGIEDALGIDSELAQRKYILRFSYDYVQDPYLGNDNGRGIYNSGVRDIHSYQLGFGTLISKRFLLSATLPVHKVELQGQESDTELGDVRVQGKYRLTADNAGINVALIPFFSIPTGDEDLVVGRDSIGYGLRVAIDKTFGRVKLFLNLGYEGYDADTSVVDRSNVATGAFGIFYKANSWLGFNAEYDRDLNLDGGDFRNPQAVRLAARFTTGQAHWFLGSGIESSRGFEQQDFNIYAGVKLGLGKLKSCGASCKKSCCKKPVMVKKPAPKKTVEVVAKELSVERNVQFASGSTTIKEVSYAELDSAARTIVEYQDQIGAIVVEGHTDSQGRAISNKRLSQKRAEAVKAYLIGKGVASSKISAVGYGESRLKINPDKTAADRAANRRVVFKVNAKVKPVK